MSGRDVVVTGMGVIHALGDRVDAVFDALCAGRSAFTAPTVFGPDVAEGHLAAEVPSFAAEKYVRPGNIRPLDRTGRLALVGVELTLADSGWTLEARQSQPIGLVVGTMFCGVRTIGEFDRRAQQAGPEYASPLDFSNTVLNAAAGQVAIWHKLRGVNSTIACGAASSVQALGYAARLVRTGRADVVVAGGVDELCFESFLGFSRAGRLAPANGNGGPRPFDARRNGTVLGEGASFLVLEPADLAAARNARILGRVLGSASGYDPAAGGDDGRALAQTIERALRAAHVDAGAIGAVSASANGSPELDAREAAGIAAALGSRTPVTAVKTTTGEVLGASGAIQAIAALETMRTGRLPGITGLTDPDPLVRLDVSASTRTVHASHALVTALTPEGNCAALVVAKS